MDNGYWDFLTPWSHKFPIRVEDNSRPLPTVTSILRHYTPSSYETLLNL